MPIRCVLRRISGSIKIVRSKDAMQEAVQAWQRVADTINSLRRMQSGIVWNIQNSHFIDEDRCINAQRLEEAFYSSKTPDPVEDTEPKTVDTAVTESDESDAAKILELLKNPETAALLKQLAKAL